MNKKKLIVAISFVFIICVSLVYAKNNFKYRSIDITSNESKNNKNSVIYKYESKEAIQKSNYNVSKDSIGVHSININGTVKIKKTTNSLKITSLDEIEDKLGIKLLKNNNIEYKYFDVFNTNIKNELFKSFIEEPTEIRITMSNYKNFACDDFIYLFSNKTNQQKIEERNKNTEKEYNKCKQDMDYNKPEKRLNLEIVFKTQHASKKEIENFGFYLEDFKNQKVEVYDSKKLNTKIFISKQDKYIFVYNNIIYILDNSNHDYKKEELLNEIETMKYSSEMINVKL